MTSAHDYTRAFRLPGGRWSVHHGFRLDRQQRAYKRAEYPCFYIVDGVLQAVSPFTVATAERTPTLILSLIARKGEPLFGREQTRWLRKIALLTKQNGWAWHVSPYRKRARRGKSLNYYPDFYSLVGKGRISTGPITRQEDYLGALHEMGHLVVNVNNTPSTFLEVEAKAWYFALAHACERLTQETLADMVRSYRSYLRLHRKHNRYRNAPLPVPMLARSLVAEFRDCEGDAACYRHTLAYLMNQQVDHRVATSRKA